MLKYKEFLTNKLNECIIFGKEINDSFILFKSRDRGYYSDNKIVHTILNDIEICYIEDIDSGWKEGMNEFGIGIINSRFSASDIEEPIKQFKAKAYDKATISKIKSEKEKYILEILECKSFDQALETILKKNKIKGVTLISDGNQLAEIEITEDYGTEYRVHKIEDYTINNKFIVRTNHGILIPDAGYQEKPGTMDRHSSEIRKLQTERFLIGNKYSIEDIFSKMSQQPFEKDSEMNTFRTTIKSKTGGQILMDLKNKIFYYSPKDSENAFKGIINTLKEPSKIKIKII